MISMRVYRGPVGLWFNTAVTLKELSQLTEFYPRHSTRARDVTMMGKRLNSGLLVSFASGVVEKELLDETTIRHIQGHLWLSKLAVWVFCMGNRA